jgi:carboxypeptidase C (cathepsin A)
MTYILLSGDVGGNWEWGSRRDPPGASDDLRNLLALGPSFRLMVAHGRSDLVTPYGVSRYVLDELPQPSDPSRIQLKLYGGGHMFYFAAEERRNFTAAARDFYQRSP